ncbi:MAG: ornithine cyclodeaminase family protein [Sandaracinaceae bacterium]|jgi:alanine dehydrogenase|nr:ornithine cyclodeaminase family protein [Sandaracinaceae bacterium]
MKTLILTEKDVRALVTMSDAVSAVETAFLAHGQGKTRMPSKVYLSLPEYGGDFRAMPSYMEGAAGVKWVNSHPENPAKHGLPSVMGVYILSDPASAAPLAIMDATWLTAMRTGAAGGVASKYLAKKQPRSIGFVGCGVQARVLLAAHQALFSNVELRMADLSGEAAARFAKEANGRVTSVNEAVASDIVCASTPGRVPVVLKRAVQAGTHINAMGADAPGKQEVEGSVLTNAKVFIDDWDQATHSGEVNVPLHRGEYAQDAITGTLGEVIAGKIQGRVGNEITLFDSTGLAVQDLALARVIYAKARESGRGIDVAMIGQG